jgi:hypothetical protein
MALACRLANITAAGCNAGKRDAKMNGRLTGGRFALQGQGCRLLLTHGSHANRRMIA